MVSAVSLIETGAAVPFTREADGSRCRRDKKVTITPRDDLPLIRLVAQNVSQELAQELLGEYEKKLLEQLRG